MSACCQLVLGATLRAVILICGDNLGMISTRTVIILTLETERLILRPWEKADEEEYRTDDIVMLKKEPQGNPAK